MKISDLKQPYRRMAEYLAEKNTNESKGVIYLNNAFDWGLTSGFFWSDVDYGKHPPITEEIKQHFPKDFDFSGEDISGRIYLDNDGNHRIDKVGLNEHYTQLVKEGKFDELPDTCEFSKAVKLEVCDGGTISQIAKVIGKFKGKFVEKEDISRNGYTFWNFAQLPAKKIDFSTFNAGDVVEVETDVNGVYYGIIKDKNKDSIHLVSSKLSATTISIHNKEIKSITKIK